MVDMDEVRRCGDRNEWGKKGGQGHVGEIYTRFEGDGNTIGEAPGRAGLAGAILQIALLDVVFSLDSVITAVGMVSHLPIMIAAVVIAVAVMVLAASATTAFVERHPTVKMLVLSFLLLIGMTLIADGFGMHVPKGYIYAAISFRPAWRCSTSSPAGGSRHALHERMGPVLHKEPDEPEPRDERSALEASATSTAAPRAAILRLDGAAGG